jgi:hypothetical protein
VDIVHLELLRQVFLAVRMENTRHTRAKRSTVGGTNFHEFKGGDSRPAFEHG